MTKKRDLKRRVRERLARTGESYVTARRRLLAGREPGPASVSVIELSDVSAQAAALGFRCQIRMFPSLAEVAEARIVLAGLRDALVGARGDLAAVRMFDVAFGIRSIAASPRDEGLASDARKLSELPGQVSARLREELARVARKSALPFRIAGRDGVVPVLCNVLGSGLILTAIHERMAAELSSLAPMRLRSWDATDLGYRPGDTVRIIEGPFVGYTATVTEVRAGDRRLQVSLSILGIATPVELVVSQVARPAPKLFLIFDGREHWITTQSFVIGRGRKICDLAISDGMISRKHAAVISRDGAHYIKDLGSANGIEYKGMRIDNKRIEDGDVFRLGDHELRFQFRFDD